MVKFKIKRPIQDRIRHDLLKVRPSKLHGKGVFAKRPITKGTLLGFYAGNIHNDEQQKNGMLMLLDSKPPWIPQKMWGLGFRYVDGSNILKCVNGAKKKHQFKAINVVVAANGMFVAANNISPDTELLISYGSYFWT